MQQSRLNLRKLNDPELDNFLLSRKPMIRTKTGLINHYLRKHNDELETIHSSPSIQNPEKQHPILDLYSKSKELKKGPNNQFRSSRMVSSSLNNGIKKDLGHDLDQLTKGNQHESNLSPHPSLTIMVQPNKIDYSERSM